MRNRAIDASNYQFCSGERILIDANVWLFLQPPAAQPPPAYARRYSATLRNLLSANAQPVIEVLVLSEYINRYLRLEYDVSWAHSYPRFKQFRNSQDFATVATSAIADVRQIMTLAVAQDTTFSQADLPGILDETQKGSFDFNDGVLVETCRDQGWKFLTDDADMQLGGIEVLTTNRRLLAACP